MTTVLVPISAAKVDRGTDRLNHEVANHESHQKRNLSSEGAQHVARNDTPNQGRKLHLLVTARDAAGSEGTAHVTVTFI